MEGSMTGCTTIHSRRARQGGLGLIEVLIAVLVFAVGVLGMAAMQISAKRASYEATQRSMATSLARDIIERIRSNPDLLNSYQVTNIGQDALPPAPSAGACVSTACDPNDLVVYDLYDWSQLLVGESEKSGSALVGGLLNSRACIDNDAGTLWVAIAWQGVNEMVNPAPAAPPTIIRDCGNGLAAYQSPPGDTQNKLRRLLVMSTYIGEP